MVKKIILLLVLVSCGNQEDIERYKIDEAKVKRIVNEKDLISHTDFNTDKSIKNPDYPIELALYKNNKFYYSLPTLSDGTGHGIWKFHEGSIVLYAQRDLFDMYIEIYAADPEGENYLITFIDRFGKKTLKVKNINFIEEEL